MLSEEQIKVIVTAAKVQDVLIEELRLVAFTNRLMIVAAEISGLVEQKNHDYGDAWQRFGIFTPLVRINDKILRVQNLSDGKVALVADEAIEDTLRDIIGYAALALLYLDAQKNGK